MALNFKSLLTRTFTAAVFVAVLLTSICWNYYSFAGLFFIVSIWGLHEFFKISELLGAKPFKVIGFSASIVLYLSAFLSNRFSILFEDMYFTNPLPLPNSDFIYLIGIGLIFAIFINALFSKEENPIQNTGFTILGVFYCTFPFIFLNKLIWLSGMMQPPIDLVYLKPHEYNPHVILGIILLIWASDTYAYLVGSLIGKRKLYERISPGKTWEGTLGSAVLTMASSYIIAQWFPEIGFSHWLVISIIVMIFGTLGDLFESLLKRQAGIKDSGKIMPGHGGILDRFDSLMFVSPFVYLYLNWVLG